MRTSRPNPILAPAQQRHGIALLLAIIVILVTTSISISLVRMVTLRHARFEQTQWKEQADLFAQAALLRAERMVQQDSSYTGETWKVDFPSEATQSGVARITVQNDPQTKTALVRVVAIVPDHPQHRSQVTRIREVKQP